MAHLHLSVQEPVLEPILEPVLEPTREPVLEPMPEPVLEPMPEPMPDVRRMISLAKRQTLLCRAGSLPEGGLVRLATQRTTV